MRARQCGVDHSRYWDGGGLALDSSLRQIAVSNQIGQSLEKFAQIDVGSMKIEQALDENRHGDSATQEDKPHKRPTLLHVVDHLGHISEGGGKRNCGVANGNGAMVTDRGWSRVISNQWSVVSGQSQVSRRGTKNPACPRSTKNETIPRHIARTFPGLRHLLPMFRLITDLLITDYFAPPLTSCHLAYALPAAALSLAGAGRRR